MYLQPVVKAGSTTQKECYNVANESSSKGRGISINYIQICHAENKCNKNAKNNHKAVNTYIIFKLFY